MVTITINGITAQAQVVDRVSLYFFHLSVADDDRSVRVAALGTWISAVVSSIRLGAPTPKVSCTAPGLSAVAQCPRRLPPNSQSRLRPAPAPFPAVQALRLLPPPLLSLPRAPIRVHLPLLRPLLVLQPPLPLGYLLKVCIYWVTLVNSF